MVRLLATLTVITCSLSLAQSVPGSITFNARLSDTAGAAVTGSHSMAFGLYDQATGGAPTWTENLAGASFSAEGLVYVELGAVTPLTTSALDGRKLYLEISVDGTTMTPRLPVVSVPYAIRASVATTADSVGSLAASAIQRRVTGTCPAGQAVRSVDSNGGVQCEPVGASPMTCASGEVLKSNGTGWVCAADAVGITGVTAGAGLTGGGGTAPTLSVVYGSAAGTAAQGNDPRLSDARAPTAASPSYVQNQAAGAQVASFNVSGSGAVGTSFAIGGNDVLSLFPFYRITSNEVLTGTTSGTTTDTVSGWQWNTACGVTLRYMFTVANNIPWASRSAGDQALLTAMGRANIQYVERPFNVYRMAWDNGPCSWTMFQHVPTQQWLTTAAFTKLESGTIAGYWATGITTSWSLTGTHLPMASEGYTHPHPSTSTVTGSILLAMPATVVGWVDLTRPINWGWFPYVSADTAP